MWWSQDIYTEHINCLCVALSCHLEPRDRAHCNYPTKESSSNFLFTLSGIVFFTNHSSLFWIQKKFVAIKTYEEYLKIYLFQCPPHTYKIHRGIILSINRMENMFHWMEQVDGTYGCSVFRKMVCKPKKITFWFLCLVFSFCSSYRTSAITWNEKIMMNLWSREEGMTLNEFIWQKVCRFWEGHC